MASKGPVVNVRYQSAAQLSKFKKAAKLCRWSLNTFLLAAADRYAFEVLSSQPEKQTPGEQVTESVQQSTDSQ
jgi:uncharacterized protein (DUF1778 family)